MLAQLIGRAALFAMGGACVFGCATERELIDRSAGAGMSPCAFWPPPSGYKLGVYAYVYERRQNQAHGEASREASATAQLHAGGLSHLGDSPFFDAD